jgi:4-oxalocrotonate tautomerase
MAVAILEIFEGHSVDEKRQLVKDITDALVKMGEEANSVQVIIRENTRSCWAEAGRLCSDFEAPPGA